AAGRSWSVRSWARVSGKLSLRGIPVLNESDSPSLGGIRYRREARQRPELADEMRQVRVPRLRGERGPARLAGGGPPPLDGVHRPAEPEHPGENLGTEPDRMPERALQPPLPQPERGGELPDPDPAPRPPQQ